MVMLAAPVPASTRTDRRLCHCDKCSLCPKGQQPERTVSGAGSAEPLLVVVGEAPGAFEVGRGVPFIGPSGKLLWKALTTGSSIRPPNVYATNALLCLPPKGAATTSKQIQACNERLLAELDSLAGPHLKVILLAGAKAAEAVTGHKVAIGTMNARTEWSERWHAWLVYSYHPAAVLRTATLYTDFAYALSIARDACYWPAGPIDRSQAIEYSVARSPRDVLALVDALAEADPIACDIETTGLDPMSDRVLEIGFAASGTHAYIIPAELLDDTEAYYAVKDLLEDHSRVWIWHNGKFDTNMLRAAFDIDARIGADTLLMHHALDERGGGEEGGHHDLKSLATKFCGAPHYAKDIDGKHMLAVPESERWRYHAYDLCYTYRLYGTLRHALAKEPPSHAGYPMPLDTHDKFLVPVANAIADVELRGIRIDIRRWDSLVADYQTRIAALKRQLREAVGKVDFNPNSTKQVGAALEGLGYPVGKSTAEAVLHELQEWDRERGAQPNDILTGVLEYRSLKHTLATYLLGLGARLFLRGQVDDIRLRTHLLMHGTATGRLASRDPNLQNIPKDSPIREMFVPSVGYTFVEADYAQLEVRVLAWMSRDPALIATIGEKDVHWATASRVWPALVRKMQTHKVDLAKLESVCHGASMFQDFAIRQEGPDRTTDPAELYDWMFTRIRRQAKYVTFGIMYGEGAESLSKGEKGLGVSVAEAQRYIDNWRTTYAVAWVWLQTQAAHAKGDRWVEAPSGRRRRFGYPDELSHVANEAMNFAIQSFASDINLAALDRLNRELRVRDLGYVLLPVHDSQLFEIRTERLAEGKALIREVMTGVLPDDEVLFDIDMKVGTTWANLHK